MIRESNIDKNVSEEVGPVINECEWILDDSSDFVRSVRDRMEATKEERGKITFADVFDKWREQIGLEELLENLAAQLGVILDGYVVPFFGIYIQSITVWEAVTNALDHGANYCRRGPVRVKLAFGPKGIMLTIVDPGTGFDFEKFLELEAENSTNNQRIYEGYGLKRIADSKRMEAWFVKGENSFTTNLLFKVFESNTQGVLEESK